MPSLVEPGLPRALFEAMARGLAIITTDVGGIPTIIKNGFNGLLVKPGDVNQIKTALQKILVNNSLKQTLISNGHQTAKEVSFEKEAFRMLDIIKSHLIREAP